MTDKNYPEGIPPQQQQSYVSKSFTTYEYNQGQPGAAAGCQNRLTSARMKSNSDIDHNITINTDYLEVSIKIKDPKNIMRGYSSYPSPQDFLSTSLSNDFEKDPLEIEEVEKDGSFMPVIVGLSPCGDQIPISDMHSACEPEKMIYEKVEYSSLEEERRETITRVDPDVLFGMLLQCHQCHPHQRFSNRLEAFGHLQNVHGLKYCPVCFQLINCHDTFMQEHLKKNHFINFQGDVHCPICFDVFNYILCFDHISKRHLKPLEATHPLHVTSNQNIQPGFPASAFIKSEFPDGEEQNELFPVNEKLTPLNVPSGFDPVRRIPRMRIASNFKNQNGLSILKNFFKKNRYPSTLEKQELARLCNRTEHQITVFFQNQRHPNHHVRIGNFSTFQREGLLTAFEKNCYPSIEDKDRLVKELGLTYAEIGYWFCMKRKNMKKRKPSSNCVSRNLRIVSSSQQSLTLARKRITKTYGTKQKSMQGNPEIACKEIIPLVGGNGSNTSDAVINHQKEKAKTIPKLIQSKAVNKIERRKIPLHAKMHLLQLFEKKQYPTVAEKQDLKENTGLKYAQIQQYFLNKRAGLKRDLRNSTTLDSHKKDHLLEKCYKLENFDILEETDIRYSYPTNFTLEQLEVLNEKFNSNMKPNSDEIAAISNLVNLDCDTVAKWFKNRLRRFQRTKLPATDDLAKLKPLLNIGKTLKEVDLPKQKPVLKISKTLKEVDSTDRNIKNTQDNFTIDQLEVLLEKFNSNVRPNKAEIADIAKLISSSEFKVKIWFRNRVQRLKRGNLPGYNLQKKKSLIEKWKKQRKADLQEARMINVAAKEFTDNQLELLIEKFNSNVRPNTVQFAEISHLVDSTIPVVETWFANRLQRLKRGKLAGYDLKNGLAIKTEQTYTTLETPEFQLKYNNDLSDTFLNAPANMNDPTIMKPVTIKAESRKTSPSKPKLVTAANSSSISQLFARIPVVRMEKLPDSELKAMFRNAKPKEEVLTGYNKNASPAKKLSPQKSIAKSKLELPKLIHAGTKALSLRKRRQKPRNLGCKPRKILSQKDKAILLASFKINPKPSEKECLRLSGITKRSLLQIMAWFSMKRLEVRRGMLVINSDNNTVDTGTSGSDKVINHEQDSNFVESMQTGDQEMNSKVQNCDKTEDEWAVWTEPDPKQPIVTPAVESDKRRSSDKSEKIHKNLLVPEVVKMFNSIREMPTSQFELKAASCVLNFKSLLETYISCGMEGQEIIKNETKRVQDLIDFYELNFSSDQEEILVDLRIENMNVLLMQKAADQEWGNVVAKFHVEDIFRAWHHLAVYSVIREISLNEALDELSNGLTVFKDSSFVQPSWWIPPLLLHD